MAAFLESLNYNGWILPVLLALPVVGALAVWAHRLAAGDRDAAAMFARRLTLAVFVIEFLLSLATLKQRSERWARRGVVGEDALLFVAARHHVIQHVRNVHTKGTGHETVTGKNMTHPIWASFVRVPVRASTTIAGTATP